MLTLIISLIVPLNAHAEGANANTIQDESIYDLLVDRFFNKTMENDFEVDTRIPGAFAGGDFLGVAEKLSHIKKMGFSLVSVGSVFASDTYDGKRVVDYGMLERHFGTSEEFTTLIDKTHKEEMKIMVDFPIQNVSAEHVLALEVNNASWVLNNTDGTVSWDLTNEDAQQALVESALAFVKEYNVDGIRFTSIEGIDMNFLNTMIETLKNENDNLYILSNEQSDAKFDAKVLTDQEDMYRNVFKTVDQETSQMAQASVGEPIIQQVDSIDTRRFTMDAAEENMFPPTRWKIVMATLLSIPGVPVMTYGSEIAVNGAKPPESHQIYNFKTDDEIIEFIADVLYLRNSSAALRTGSMEMLHNEDGFMVYKRSNEEETWIVVINNSSKTQSFDLTKEVIGDDKELRGLFESDILRQKDDGNYRLVLDREIAEFYTVNDEKGLNKGYIVALILANLLFLGFIFLVWRKGKQQKHEDTNNKK